MPKTNHSDSDASYGPLPSPTDGTPEPDSQSLSSYDSEINLPIASARPQLRRSTSITAGRMGSVRYEPKEITARNFRSLLRKLSAGKFQEFQKLTLYPAINAFLQGNQGAMGMVFQAQVSAEVQQRILCSSPLETLPQLLSALINSSLAQRTKIAHCEAVIRQFGDKLIKPEFLHSALMKGKGSLNWNPQMEQLLSKHGLRAYDVISGSCFAGAAHAGSESSSDRGVEDASQYGAMPAAGIDLGNTSDQEAYTALEDWRKMLRDLGYDKNGCALGQASSSPAAPQGASQATLASSLSPIFRQPPSHHDNNHKEDDLTSECSSTSSHYSR